MKMVRKFSLLISLLLLLPLTAFGMEKTMTFDEQLNAQSAMVLAMNDTQNAGAKGDDKFYRRPFFNPFLFSPFYNPYSIYSYPYGYYPYNTFSYPLYIRRDYNWDGNRHWRRH